MKQKYIKAKHYIDIGVQHAEDVNRSSSCYMVDTKKRQILLRSVPIYALPRMVEQEPRPLD